MFPFFLLALLVPTPFAQHGDEGLGFDIDTADEADDDRDDRRSGLEDSPHTVERVNANGHLGHRERPRGLSFAAQARLKAMLEQSQSWKLGEDDSSLSESEED